MQGGELPLGGGLAVWVHKHLIKFQYKPCPCHLFQIGWVEDGVDFLCSPGACRSSLHVQQDEQDIAALIWELRLPHTEVEGTCQDLCHTLENSGMGPAWRVGRDTRRSP